MKGQPLTKRAIAISFKKVLLEKPFSKIRINDISDNCSINRKSFYYHFKDKYDLVNWIYYIEFEKMTKINNYNSGWDLLYEACNYFYENKDYYNKVFSVIGQNSFIDYFRELVKVRVYNSMRNSTFEKEYLDFYADFYSDIIVSSVRRWILHTDPITPIEFLNYMKWSFITISNQTVDEIPII